MNRERFLKGIYSAIKNVAIRKLFPLKSRGLIISEEEEKINFSLSGGARRNRLEVWVVREDNGYGEPFTVAVRLVVPGVIDSMVDFWPDENGNIYLNIWESNTPFIRRYIDNVENKIISLDRVIFISEIYFNAFNLLLRNLDKLLSLYFIKAKATDAILHFENLDIHIFGRLETYRIAFQGNKVFFDNLFAPNNIFVTIAIEELASFLFNHRVANFKPEEIEWYLLYGDPYSVLVQKLIPKPLYIQKRSFFIKKRIVFAGFKDYEYKTLAVFKEKEDAIFKEFINSLNFQPDNLDL
jgi:hypothetical protein